MKETEEDKGIKTMTFEECLPVIIDSEETASFILSHVRSAGFPRNESSEYAFFKTFEDVVNSVNHSFELKRQFNVLNFKVDAVIVEETENFGEYNSDKEVLSKITLFEFDEAHHKKRTKKDKERIRLIEKELLKTFDIIDIYRIPEEYSNIFLAYAIPFFGNIETSYSYDKLNELFLIKKIGV